MTGRDGQTGDHVPAAVPPSPRHVAGEVTHRGTLLLSLVDEIWRFLNSMTGRIEWLTPSSIAGRPLSPILPLELFVSPRSRSWRAGNASMLFQLREIEAWSWRVVSCRCSLPGQRRRLMVEGRDSAEKAARGWHGKIVLACRGQVAARCRFFTSLYICASSCAVPSCCWRLGLACGGLPLAGGN